MNIRTSLIGGTTAALLACACANAQILGGGIGGAVGGTLSGDMRDTGMLTRGSAAGSLGTTLDAGSLRRTTRGTLDRTTSRVRGTAARAGDHAESAVGRVRDASVDVAASTAATATQTVNAQQSHAASSLAGSASSDVESKAAQLTGSAEGGANQSAVIAPNLASPIGEDAVAAPQRSAAGGSGAVAGNTAGNTALAGLTHSPQGSQSEGDNQSEGGVAPRGLTTGTALAGSASGSTLLRQDDAPVNSSGDANGSAASSAAASRNGVSAQSSLAAEGSGSASLSTQR